MGRRGRFARQLIKLSREKSAFEAHLANDVSKRTGKLLLGKEAYNVRELLIGVPARKRAMNRSPQRGRGREFVSIALGHCSSMSSAKMRQDCREVPENMLDSLEREGTAWLVVFRQFCSLASEFFDVDLSLIVLRQRRWLLPFTGKFSA